MASLAAAFSHAHAPPSRGSVCGWSGRDARVLMTCPSSFAVGSRCGL